jgi:hypothetical protein
MDEVAIPGRAGDDRLFKQFTARYDVPAYVRRARRVQEALDGLVARCRKQRDEWLIMVRANARMALALAGSSADGELRQLASMLDLPGIPVAANPGSRRRLGRALRELAESIAHFNRRWRRYLHEVDRAPVNQLRDDYNRYYTLEKECALHSARLARLGFQPLEPLSVAELFTLLPLLPLPLGE